MIKITEDFIHLLENVFKDVEYEEFIDNGNTNIWMRISGEDVEQNWFTLDIDAYTDKIHLKRYGDIATLDHIMDNIFESNEQLLMFLLKEKFIPPYCEFLADIYITPSMNFAKFIGYTKCEEYIIYEYLTGIEGYVGEDTRFEVVKYNDPTFVDINNVFGVE